MRRSRSDVIGRTLRLTETRGARRGLPSAHASRKSAICSACSSSNGTAVSSRRSVELIRFIPCSTGPHRGLATSRAPPDALGKPGRLRLDRRASRATGAVARIGVHDTGAGDRSAEERGLRPRVVAVVHALGRRVAEPFEAAVRGLGGAATDAELQPAAAEQIGNRGFLRHVQGVLVAHVDHRRADLDPARPHADRREQRERRRELPREVMHADERAVDAELLRGDRELDRLDERFAGRRRPRPLRLLPVAEGEKADPFPGASLIPTIEARTRARRAANLQAARARALRHREDLRFTGRRQQRSDT